MVCDKPQIPEYLHYNKDIKKEYSSNSFKSCHLLFITGFLGDVNPIQFPSTSTSISSCWSKLIKQSDVLKTVLAHNPKLGNHIFYGKIREIKNFKIIEECVTGWYAGIHKLETEIFHKPVPCNYSHSEILIRHTFYDDSKLQSILVEHDDWKNCVLKKGKPKDFFKEIDIQFRAAIATILNNDVNDPHFPFYPSFIPKRFLIKFMLWFNLNK